MRPTSFSFPSDAAKTEALQDVAKQYRDEGYDVVVAPQGAAVPSFAADFRPDLIATRANEGVIVEVKRNRLDLSSDPDIPRMAEVVNAQPGWRLDVVVLEPVTEVQTAAQDAAEPSDEQLLQILKSADDMADKGETPYACVVAWAGIEAAMRRLRDEAEFYGRSAPKDLMRTLYVNGVLSREQFDRLKESYKIRTQVVHGLVPQPVEPKLVHDVTTIARYLAAEAIAALPSM